MITITKLQCKIHNIKKFQVKKCIVTGSAVSLWLALLTAKILVRIGDNVSYPKLLRSRDLKFLQCIFYWYIVVLFVLGRVCFSSDVVLYSVERWWRQRCCCA